MTGQNIVVTGASRGLGLEMVRQLVAAGHRVAALARQPPAELRQAAGDDGLVVACDVADQASVDGAFAEIAAAMHSVDLLVNNAGVMGQRADLGALDFDDLLRTFAVNAVGPLRVTRACLPLLRRGASPRVVHVTSKMGSIADNTSGGVYAYRMSKCALNMAASNLHLELAPSVLSVVMHPGWVQTDMGGGAAPLEVPDAVGRMLATMRALRPEHGGAFVDLDGAPLPW